MEQTSVAAAACGQMDNWDEAFEEELLKSQEDADLIDEACEARTSGSDEETEANAWWWLDTLKQLIREKQLRWPRNPGGRPWRVLSGCSGVCSEAEVMKAWLPNTQLQRL